jgi:hypothetical protein
LVLRQVVEEHLEVSIEGELPGSVSRDEAEDLHGAVGSDVKVPVETSKVHGGDFAADGVYTSDSCKPLENQLGFEGAIVQTHQTMSS